MSLFRKGERGPSVRNGQSQLKCSHRFAVNTAPALFALSLLLISPLSIVLQEAAVVLAESIFPLV